MSNKKMSFCNKDGQKCFHSNRRTDKMVAGEDYFCPFQKQSTDMFQLNYCKFQQIGWSLVQDWSRPSSAPHMVAFARVAGHC